MNSCNIRARFIAQVLILTALILGGTTLHASDLAKEKRWAEQIEEALLDGEMVYLNDGTNDFLSIDTPAENTIKPSTSAGIILLHGTGAHPDWPQVIYPLRTQLSEAGWRSLSLQLPILDNQASGADYDAIMPEAAPRILAGIEYFKKSGIKQMIIIAHSFGTLMSGDALLTPNNSVIGFIGIGMGSGTTQFLGKLDIPVLDLLGAEDLEGVIRSAPMRKRSASQNSNYAQFVVPNADHFFDGEEKQLLEIVLNWLRNTVK